MSTRIIPENFGKNQFVTYFWKGRVALYAILKACGIGPGDEVILQGFTCVAVPNPILYMGAVPVYVDIDTETYNASPNAVFEAVTSKTKAIILQNTFGLAPDYDPVIRQVKDKGIWVIGDCAHGLGASYKGKEEGTIADISFYSFQWTKPITAGLGGVAITQNKALAKCISKVHSQAIEPSWKEMMMLIMQLTAYKYLLRPYNYWMAVELYRWLTRKLNISVGSTSGEEISGTLEPHEFQKRMSNVQHFVLQRKLCHLEKIVKSRTDVADYYDDIMKELGISTPLRPQYAKHSFLRYPIRVQNNEKSLELAKKNKLAIGDWFSSPVYPIKSQLERWRYLSGSCEKAEKASVQVINLPTDSPLDKKDIISVLN